MAKRTGTACLGFWERRRNLVAVALLAIVVVVVASGEGLARADSGASSATPAVGSEVVSLRTADSRTFVGPNDTLDAHVYSEPVNYLDANGDWQHDNNTLIAATDAGAPGYENAANAFHVGLPQTLGLAPVTVSSGQYSVSFSLDDASGYGITSGSSETFAGALPGVDLRYTVANTRLEEDLVLAGPSSPSSFTYSVSTSPGLTAVLAMDGSIQFVDASGTSRLWFFPPNMTDAAGMSGPASFSLATTDTGYRVTLSADSSWLASPDRAWPVTIDPGAMGEFWDQSTNPTVDGYLASGTSASSNFFSGTTDKVGWNSTSASRTLQQYNTESILTANGAKGQVLNAELKVYLNSKGTSTNAAVGVYSPTRSWTSSATWNKYDGTNSWGTAGGNFTTDPATSALPWGQTTVGATTGAYYTWNVTRLVEGWNDGTVPDNGLLLKSLSESSSQNVFTFSNARATTHLPYIAITYYNRAGAFAADTYRTVPLTDSLSANINVGNGSLDMCQTDLSLPGVAGFGLTLKRCIDSTRSINTEQMDNYWYLTPGIETFLEPVSAAGDTGTGVGTLIYHGDSGDLQPFTPAASGGAYVGPTGYNATLTTSSTTLCGGTAAYVLTFHSDGSKRYFKAGVNSLASDSLLAEEDANGNTICFYYDPSVGLDHIVDTQGRTISFSYNSILGGNGYQLATLTAPGTNCPSGTCTYHYGYHSDGSLGSFTDPTGAITQYTYSAAGQLASITDPRNNTSSFTWNTVTGGYQIASLTDATNKTTTFTYLDTSGGFCSSGSTDITDPASSNPTRYCTDGGLRVVSVKAPDGSLSTTAYTDTSNGVNGCTDTYGESLDAQPCSSTDGSGNTTTYSYSSARPEDLTVTTDPSGAATTALYGDSSHPYLPTSVTSPPDASGNYTITTYAYDSAGNATDMTVKSYDSHGTLIGTAESSAATFSGCAAAPGQVCLSENGDGYWTQYAYGSSGNVTSQTGGLDASGACPSGDLCPTTTYTYDSAGRVLTEVAPRGGVSGNNPSDYTTTYTYDRDGRLLTKTDPLGHTTTYTYDSPGNQTTVTDPLGHTTTYAYDANNRLITVTAPDPDGSGPLTAPVTSYTYDWNGNQSSKTDPNGYATTSTYNAANELASTTTPLGGETTYGYDSNGNVTTTVDPRGNVVGGNPSLYTTTKTYWPDGQLKTVTDPLGNATSYAYDPVGNQTGVTDANSHTTDLTYDGQGSVLTLTAPDGGVTTYTYDGSGNVLTRNDANGHTTAYTYDNNGNLSTITGPDPDGSGPLTAAVTAFEYDANGNKIETTAPDGNTTTYGYDHANRRTSVTYSDSTSPAAYTYDAAGRRTSMTDGAGVVTYTYDNDNRLLTVARGSDTFTYTYDTAGNIISRTYPGSTTTTYTYNHDEQLATAASGGNTTSYTYDSADKLLTTTLPNGYVETRTYDTAGEVTDVNNARSGTTLSDYAYTYDPVGNRTKVVQTGSVSGTALFGYDASNRLIDTCYQSAICNEGTGSSDPYIHYTYDQAGNRLSEKRPSGTTSYTYNSVDELTSAGSTTYTYDANGNQTVGGSRTYTYTAANQTTSATSGGTTTNYAYDGDGNRLSASTSTTTTNYIWDTNYLFPQLAVERDSSNNVLRSYVYGTSGRRIAMNSGGNPYYYQYDALGSVVNLTSSSGATEWSYAYDPFGGTRTQTKNDPNAPENPMQFAGELIDAPSGLYDLRARQFDPTTGRFTTQDPLAPTATGIQSSSYNYAADNPIIYLDPSGLCLGIPFSGACPWDPATHLIGTAFHATVDGAASVIYGPYYFSYRLQRWISRKNHIVGHITSGPLFVLFGAPSLAGDAALDVVKMAFGWEKSPADEHVTNWHFPKIWLPGLWWKHGPHVDWSW